MITHDKFRFGSIYITEITRNPIGSINYFEIDKRGERTVERENPQALFERIKYYEMLGAKIKIEGYESGFEDTPLFFKKKTEIRSRPFSLESSSFLYEFQYYVKIPQLGFFRVAVQFFF